MRGSRPRLVWEPTPLNMRLDDVLGDEQALGEKEQGAVDRARAFLREFVGDRPVQATTAFKHGLELEISEAAVKRAKRIEPIETIKIDNSWWWRYERPKTEAKPPELGLTDSQPMPWLCS